MKKQEYIKRYIEKLEKALNECNDAYEFNDIIQCEYCPFCKDGKFCIQTEGICCIDKMRRDVEYDVEY